MREFKGTPGPYETNGIIIRNSKGTKVCSIIEIEGQSDDTETIANSKLMSASYDLLAVCLKMQDHINNTLMAKSPFGLDEAINKALIEPPELLEAVNNG